MRTTGWMMKKDTEIVFLVLTVVLVASSSWAYTMKKKRSTIVFPGDTDGERILPVRLGGEIPSCAQGNTYCEDQSVFPKDIGNILENLDPMFKLALGQVPIPERHDFDVESVCHGESVTVYPTMAENKEKEWMLVVNHEDYVQAVEVEKCTREGKPCSLWEGATNSYDTICRQKYLYKKLVALKSDGKATVDSFLLPSCCACYTKSNFIPSRFGNNTHK